MLRINWQEAMGKHRWAIMATVLIHLVGFGTAMAYRVVYDHVLPHAATASLFVLSLGLLIALAIDALLRHGRAVAEEEMAKGDDRRGAVALFARIIGAKLEGIADSQLVASALSQLETVRDAHGSSTILAVVDAFAAVIFIVALAWISLPLAIIPVVLLAILIANAKLTENRVVEAAKASAQINIARQALVDETVAGIMDIKALNAGEFFESRFADLSAKAAEANSALRLIGHHSNLFSSSAVTLTQAVTLVAGSMLIINGDLSMGALIASTILSGRVVAPLNALANVLPKLARAKAAQSIIDKVANADQEMVTNPWPMETTSGAITVANVSYTYAGAPTSTLDDVSSLSLAAGERIALVGSNGCGKSTLLSLLDGLHQPQAGVVSLDGINTSLLDPIQLRSHIGLVSQHPNLFSGTVGGNITLGLEVKEAKLVEALNLSGVGVWAKTVGLAYPVVEERGGSGNLSGGQRQSIALARAILRDPKVLLLDEPTSHLDGLAKTRLLHALNAWANAGKRGLIIATHDLQLISSGLVSRVVTMEAGRIIQNDSVKEYLDRVIPHHAMKRSA